MTMLLLSAAVSAQEKIDLHDLAAKKIYKISAALSSDTLPQEIAQNDSLKTKATAKIDSIRALTSSPATKLNAASSRASTKLDSLKHVLKIPVPKTPGDSLLQKPASGITGAEKSIQHLEGSIQ